MVYEVIGKVVLYIIGTLLIGGVFCALDDTSDFSGVFFGAWFVGIVVFLTLILPPTT